MAGPIAWSDMKMRAKERGLLGKELFVVLTSPVGTMEAIMAVLPEHVRFQKDLEARGIMFAAGPLADVENPEMWTGEGMVVVRADSLEEARAIAASDPMHTSGARSFVVRRWLVNEGGFTLNVGFSSGGYTLI